jgi:hypothetical protein
MLSVPASFSVAAGSTLASVTITTASISTSQNATVRATIGSVSQATTVGLVAPTTPTSLACAPGILGPKASGTCVVTFNQAVPAGGAVIAISNTNSLLKVPTSVSSAAGSVSASFTATAGAVTGSQSATITATVGSVSKMATIGLVAPLGLTDSLSLTSGSAGSDGQASLNLNLTSPAGNEPTAIQWTVTYPLSNVVSLSVAEGPAASAAGKTLNCVAGAESYTCMLSGSNMTIMSNGPVAVVSLTMASGASTTPIGLIESLGSSGAGNVIVVAPAGSAVN